MALITSPARFGGPTKRSVYLCEIESVFQRAEDYRCDVDQARVITKIPVPRAKPSLHRPKAVRVRDWCGRFPQELRGHPTRVPGRQPVHAASVTRRARAAASRCGALRAGER